MNNGKSGSKSVVISLDAELIWGFHNSETIPGERVESARESWRYLLNCFERYSIPATWTIVGHLFLDKCNGTHANHPAGPEWFARDPGGQSNTDSHWFGPDLVREVLESTVEHEIGSHSFSHIEFGHPETTVDQAAAELTYSRYAAKEYDIELESFVFPRNNVGHRSVLSEHGFKCYRGVNPGRWYDETSIRKFGKFVTFAVGTSGPPIVSPEIDEYGLVNIPASLYLFTFEGTAGNIVKTIRGDPVVRQVKLGLEKLVQKEHGVLHLWLHPNNITSEADRTRMEAILSLVSEYRNNKDVTISTMKQVAEQVRNDREFNPSV